MLQPSAVYLPQKHKMSSKPTMYHERKKKLSTRVVSDPLAIALAMQCSIS